jgi:hypothetical protein
MLTEILGKGGNLCPQAKSGEIRCPLIVRPTSEDVVTGQVFESLGYLNPRWWLPDLLNTALGTNRFQRQFFRGLRIRLWENLPCYPAELLPWPEGSTQVDVMISWENPRTTVFIEAKYGSGLSPHVSADDGTSGYPSDQLIRNIRVGLHHCGYLDSGDRLFDQQPRNLIVLVLSPTNGHALVERYRNDRNLLAAIPFSDRLVGLPRGPFVGQLDFEDIRTVLQGQARWMTSGERRVAQGLNSYLEFKRGSLPARSARSSPSLMSRPVALRGLQDAPTTRVRPDSGSPEFLSVD